MTVIFLNWRQQLYICARSPRTYRTGPGSLTVKSNRMKSSRMKMQSCELHEEGKFATSFTDTIKVKVKSYFQM